MVKTEKRMRMVNEEEEEKGGGGRVENDGTQGDTVANGNDDVRRDDRFPSVGEYARLGGGSSLSKSFRSAMSGTGGGLLRGSMRLKALKRKEDAKKKDKEMKKTLRTKRRERKTSGRIKLTAESTLNSPKVKARNSTSITQEENRGEKVKRKKSQSKKNTSNGDVEIDESKLIRLATKGVVQLFNVVTKVQQRQLQNGDGDNINKMNGSKFKSSSSKSSSVNKFSFISELKKLSPGDPLNASITPNGNQKVPDSQTKDNDDGIVAWSVLKDDFGIGQRRMKDWEKGEEIEKDKTNKSNRIQKKRGLSSESEIDDGAIEFEDDDDDDDDDDEDDDMFL